MAAMPCVTPCTLAARSKNCWSVFRFDFAGDEGAGGNALAFLVDRDLLETIDIAAQVGPFVGDPGRPAVIGQVLL